jgi:hypothetical protein
METKGVACWLSSGGARVARLVLIALLFALEPLVSFAQSAPDVSELTAHLQDADRAVRLRALQIIESTDGGGANFDDLMFEAAHVWQDVEAEPVRALALYQRIVNQYPNGRLAASCRRRIEQLQQWVATDEVTAAMSHRLATIRAHSDDIPYPVVVALMKTVLSSEWRGRAEAALWLGEYQRRIGLLPEASEQLQTVVTTWPETHAAMIAQRELATLAIEQRQWQRARSLAAKIDRSDPADAALVEGIMTAALRGARLEAWYVVAQWVALAVVGLLLVAFARSVATSDNRRRALAPPIEFWFAAPLLALLYGAALTAHSAIAPAVLTITGYGAAGSWMVGSILQELSNRGRRLRWYATAFAIIAAFGAVAIAYVALMRQGLLFDMIETLRFGPSVE